MSLNENNIVLADSWTNGSHHFDPYIDELISIGYNIYYLHTNSLNNVKNINNKRLDITYIDLYLDGCGKTLELFRNNKVKMVFFLSTNSLLLETINSLAIRNNILTTHIYHGFNSLVNWNYLTSLNHKLSFNNLVSKVIKNLRLLKILILLKSKNSSYKSVIINMIFRSFKRFTKYSPHGSKESFHKTNFGIVFVKRIQII